MGLGKYRPYKMNSTMRAMKKSNSTCRFCTGFYNRNTIQVWDVSSVASVEVRKWKGVTLEDRSLHEITIVNNNNTAKAIKFSSIYSLPDSDSIDEQEVLLGPQGSAHFYCTASLVENNLVFTMRKGSQDKRNV
jgi:hypothetical protein